jgi:biopolymer transport protein ExbB/TolQ
MTQVYRNLAVMVVVIVAVHLAYVGYIWPEANLILDAAKLAGQAAPRNVTVILKDYEQEICLILMFWGMYLIGEKCFAILNSRYLFQVDLLEDYKGEENDWRSILLVLDKLPERIRETPLLRTLSASLRRFIITSNVQNTSDAIESSIEALAMKQEAENSMIRYLIWAIPSIGFIGTVRGIGEALSKADEALAGDIAGMTNSLGVAFNSTLVALLISIALMFILHQLQRLQDGLVLDTQAYCETFLLNRISAVNSAETET